MPLRRRAHADAPNQAYNANSARNWLIPQLSDINEFCSCPQKMTTRQIRQCAAIIATEHPHLKVTELMLFCWRLKSGRYGRFYGTVDPMIILEALRRFLDERATAIQRRQEQAESKRRQDQQQGTVTYQQWLEMKKKGLFKD